ncbi:hypothetical protein [Stieleria neptunia]|nr:hypothetical protein [Stieleria neptunia]
MAIKPSWTTPQQPRRPAPPTTTSFVGRCGGDSDDPLASIPCIFDKLQSGKCIGDREKEITYSEQIDYDSSGATKVCVNRVRPGPGGCDYVKGAGVYLKSVENTLAFGAMALAVFSMSACSSRSPIDERNSNSVDVSSNLMFSPCNLTELNAREEAGTLFFLLFIPESHPATQMHKAELHQVKLGDSKGLGIPAVVVSYRYAISSSDIDHLFHWLPGIRLPKDPTLVLFRNKDELARRWLGREPLSESAKILLNRNPS